MSTRARRDVHHGNTAAAWTTAIIIMIAFVIGTFAVIAGNWPLFWAAAGLVVVGAIIGKILQAAGLGAYARR